MLGINLSRQAEKFLLKVPKRQGKQIAQKLTSLREDPRPHDSLKLSGSLFFRTDIGEYRIVYEFDEQCVRILIIGKRNDDDVYRKLRRREG